MTNASNADFPVVFQGDIYFKVRVRKLCLFGLKEKNGEVKCVCSRVHVFVFHLP